MSSFIETVTSIVATAISNIAPITSGVVVHFDNETNFATVKTTHKSGRGNDYFELPWPRTMFGIVAKAPQVQTATQPGTHAVIGFRGFDWHYPVLLAAYDPLHYKNTREQDKRKPETYTTATDKKLIGTV